MSAPSSLEHAGGGRVRGRQHHGDLRLHVRREQAGRARLAEDGEHAEVGDQHAAEAVVGRAPRVVEARDDLLLAARGRRERRRRPASGPSADVSQPAFGRANRLTSTRAAAAMPRHLVELRVGEQEDAAALRDAVDAHVEPLGLLEHGLEAARPLGARDLDRGTARRPGSASRSRAARSGRRAGSPIERRKSRVSLIARAYRSGLRLLEQRLPAVEQRLQLVARRTVGGEQLHVAPVVGELAARGRRRSPPAPAISASTCSSSLGRFGCRLVPAVAFLVTFSTQSLRPGLATSADSLSTGGWSRT